MTTYEEDIDIYQEGASIAFKTPYAQVTKLQRALFKERFFLFVYSVYLRQANKEDVRALVKTVAESVRLQLSGS